MSQFKINNILKNSEASLCDELNFKRVYLKHSKDLFSFLYYKFGKNDNLDDVVQETFIKLWHKCSDVSIEKVKPFIFKVAQNLFIDYLRKKKNKVNVELTDMFLNDENTEHDLNEFDKIVDSIINNMPENYKIVFLLNRLENKKYVEIAEMLNLSVKAIEKRMHNALVYLKEAKQMYKL